MTDAAAASPPSLQRVPTQVRTALEQAACQLTSGVRVEFQGRVEAIHDGVAELSGLNDVAFESLVSIGKHQGLVMGLSPDLATIALLADTQHSQEVTVGHLARRHAGQLAINVGEQLLGRIVDPLGRPLDGGLAPRGGHAMPMDRPAPQLFERGTVHTPLYTGSLAVDAMFPIGRGQRELIAGDEGTGKTSLAVDALLRQASEDVVAVYAGIGQRRAETWRLHQQLTKAGCRFVMVTTADDASPALRYLTPFAATAVGEYFRDRGKHAVVVYDDLSAHAMAWRELSLLLGRPPGREAYPGDIFFLHSRLLERSAQLSDELGGGSLTALPICTLESGRLTAFIPTNLVSITDGQLVMNRALFSTGQRPAIDAGLSVSRVGARAQSKLLASLCAQLKVNYAAFLELEAFARLGTRLEASAQRRIELGRRVRALLRAQQGAPLDLLSELVRLALARNEGLVLRLEIDSVDQFARELTTGIASRYPEVTFQLASETLSTDRFTALVSEEAQRVFHD